MKNPAGRSDHAVTAFLLNPRQSSKELVGDILAEPGLPKKIPWHREGFLMDQAFAIGAEAP